MNDQNLGRRIKWQDEEEGWHTGRYVLNPHGQTLEEAKPIPGSHCSIKLVLVKESCDGELTWAPSAAIKPWPTQDEWTDEEKKLALTKEEKKEAKLGEKVSFNAFIPEGYHVVEDADGQRIVKNEPIVCSEVTINIFDVELELPEDDKRKLSKRYASIVDGKLHICVEIEEPTYPPELAPDSKGLAFRNALTKSINELGIDSKYGVSDYVLSETICRFLENKFRDRSEDYAKASPIVFESQAVPGDYTCCTEMPQAKPYCISRTGTGQRPNYLPPKLETNPKQNKIPVTLGYSGPTIGTAEIRPDGVATLLIERESVKTVQELLAQDNAYPFNGLGE